MIFYNKERMENIPREYIDAFVGSKENEEKIEKGEISITLNKSPIKEITGAHNYTSLATYYHPDPNSENGFPYIRKDGIVNRDVSKYSDSIYLHKMVLSTKLLSIFYYATKSEEYAQRAIKIIRSFFINEQTKMNPNLTHSQIIMAGEKDIKTRGLIIDADRLFIFSDTVEILKASSEWKDSDEENIKKWFSDMSDWFLTSPRGIRQGSYYHNIRTSYSKQLISYLCLAGRVEEAKEYISNNVKELLSKQINSDGLQVQELDRNRNRHYCNYNLALLCDLAKMCCNLGYNIWNYEDENGCGSIRKAMLHTANLYEKDWEYSDEKSSDPTTRGWLYSGVYVYDDPLFLNLFQKVKLNKNYLPEYISRPTSKNI
jgi:hypothetical protein